MFFVLSKLIYFAIVPSHICLFALGGGIILLAWQRTERLARWLLMGSFTAFFLFGFSPLGQILILPLEERFRMPENLRDGDYTGIIFLGGFEIGNISRARDTLALTDAAERLSETARLARQLPSAKVIFTGGAATLLTDGESAHRAVGHYLQDMGIAEDRLVLEGRSRNTWENATLTRRLLEPKPADRFLIVTSASHMPRAMGVFRKAGYNVVAYPVDYVTRGRADIMRPFAFLPSGLQRTDKAVKEWLGLAVYWATGRSSDLFPAP